MALPSNFVLEPLSTQTGAHIGNSYSIDNTVFHSAVDWTIWVEVTAIDYGTFARFSIQDSVDAFTTIIAGPTFEVAGGGNVSKTYPIRHSFKRADFPGLRFGVANAVMRVSLTLLQGVSPHVTYTAMYTGPLSN